MTGVAKRLFKQSKCSHWNMPLECGNTEYIHWSSCEYFLGAVSLTRASISGMATALTKKYQKKLTKVTKLVDIVTSALAVFETSVSKTLNNGKTDEQEFGMLQTLYSKSLNELTGVHQKMEAETNSKKFTGRDK